MAAKEFPEVLTQKRQSRTLAPELQPGPERVSKSRAARSSATMKNSTDFSSSLGLAEYAVLQLNHFGQKSFW